MDRFKVDHIGEDLGKAGAEEDEFWPLSGEPYFSLILAKSHVKPLYHLYLPRKIFSSLPSASCPMVLKYRGMKWDIPSVTYGRECRFYAKWKNFVIDNDLQIGDASVFELSKCNDTLIEIKVQILRGGFPVDLEKDEGTVDTPIIID